MQNMALSIESALHWWCKYPFTLERRISCGKMDGEHWHSNIL